MAQVGTVSVVATIDTMRYKRGAKEIENANRGIAGSADSSGNSMSRLNKRLGSMARTGLKVAVGGFLALGSAVAAMTIKGGISRALNIEDAQAKLRGLGHDAKSVETIMVSALDSVRGTAYGLDAAATIAASAVAAGVRPGQQLTKYLSLTADAATIAGVSLSEMGSIFNKVQTGQKAYTQELNQLADRGIPIYQWLQKELGVSQEALRDMVADGEVDSATYFKAIQKNIGGAALESGQTTRGSWANMLAAMSRIGQQIVQGPIDSMRKSFGDMTKWIDDNSSRIVAAVQSIGSYFERTGRGAIELARGVGSYLRPRLQDLRSAIQHDVVPSLRKLWDGVRPLIPAIGSALVGSIALAISTTAELLRVITALVPMIITVTSAIAGYRLAMLAWNIVSHAQAALAVVLGTRYVMLNGTIIATTAAQRGLNAVLMANPIGLVVGLLAALGGALFATSNQADRSTTAQGRLNQAREQAKIATDNLRIAEDNLRGSELNLEGTQISLARARERLTELQKSGRASALDLREAELQVKRAEDDLKRAKEDVTKATEEKNKKEQESIDKAAAVKKANDIKKLSFFEVNDSILANIGSTESLRDRLNRLNGTTVKYNISGSIDNVEAAKAAGYKSGAPAINRYAGGPVSAGRSYLVGENRDGSINDTTELFVPRQSGRIINSRDFQDAIGGKLEGGGITNNIQNVTISSEVDGERWLRRLSGNQEIVSNGLVPTQSYM